MNLLTQNQPIEKLWPWTIALPILFLITFQSCSIEDDLIDASFEVNRQRYKVNQFPASPSGSELGFNVTAYLFMGLQQVRPPGSQSNLKNPDSLQDFTMLNDTPSYSGHGMSPSNQPDFDFERVRQNLYVLAGAKLVSKRSKDGGGETKTTLNYFEIPSYLLYRKELKTGKIMGGLGPYIAYGIGGKTKHTNNGQEEKRSSFDKDEGFKRFDAGLGILASYQFPSEVYVNLGYSWGMVNINRGDFEKAKNRTFSISVMYPIDKLKELLD